MSGSLESSRAEDVDDLALRGPWPSPRPANGAVRELGRFAASQFRQRCFNGLEESDVVADFDGIVAARAQRKGLGQFRHHLDETLLAVFLFEDVLLRTRK